jgi:hypothetical protein
MVAKTRDHSLIFWFVSLVLFVCPVSLISDEELLPEAPLSIYLTWVTDPTTTMVVRWISKDSEETSEISYRKDHSENPWEKVKGATLPFPEDQPYYVHTVTITGLSADTSYRFTIEGYSEEHLFSTMPKDLSAPLTFIIGGDTNLSSLYTFDETNRQAASQNPSFVIIGGDLACAASNNTKKKEHCDRWLDWLTHWYQGMRTTDGRIIPLLLAIGNHDVKGGFGQTPEQAPFFYHLFACPGERGYTVLRFGSYLSLYLLDSGHTHSSGGEQSQWLSREMSKDPQVLHRIAIYHVPAYPDVRPYRNTYSSAIRRNFVPIFDTYHLHIAFENHDHAYKRTYPLSSDRADPNGVVYIGNGSWGVNPRIPKKPSHTSYLEKTIQARQFCKVSLSATGREVTAITYDGKIIDHFSQPVDSVVVQQRSQQEQVNRTKRIDK